jgi:hypothetical protein
MSVAAATTLARRAARFDAAAGRPLLRGICLVVKGSQPPGRRPASGTVAAKTAEFPRRPSAQTLSESIPLFFVARNENGLWVVREAEGRNGGIFLSKRSAVHFAESRSASIGCATMFPPERLELDVKNQGGAVAAWLDTMLRMARHRSRRTAGVSRLGAKHP